MHKVVISGKEGIRYTNDKSEVFGGAEPIKVVLYLNDVEYECICSIYTKNNKDVPKTLHTFAYQDSCSSYHKRKIFRIHVLPRICKIEGLILI